MRKAKLPPQNAPMQQKEGVEKRKIPTSLCMSKECSPLVENNIANCKQESAINNNHHAFDHAASIKDINQRAFEKEQILDINDSSGTSCIRGSVICSPRSLKNIDVEEDCKNVLEFKNLKMFTNKGKELISDCFATIYSGNVMAIVGPSGAGKTTLIRALTLEKFGGGKIVGSITLNGQPFTAKLFKQNCYVVKQDDNLWPHLTCQETLFYAAYFFCDVEERKKIPVIVGDILRKFGLERCSGTKCNALSGGQKRRLLVCVALLKKSTILFFDEPTTGLDSASSRKCMEEIRNIAKGENLIILCTIHQPSSKVFHEFDQLMIMSKGRQAFVGHVNIAEKYFRTIGYDLPENTNPADFYLDLVNSDFTSNSEVIKILDEWKERRELESFRCNGDLDSDIEETGFKNLLAMISRHAKIVVRDPFLYRGRLFAFFATNIFFAFVYLRARPFKQSQSLNKLWVNLWLGGIPASLDVASVYGLNLEFKLLLAEVKNGLVTPPSYIVAKSVLILPFILLSAIVSMSIAGWAIQGYLGSTYGTAIGIWAVQMLEYEFKAEAFAILLDDPIVGMLGFISTWFATFLLSGMILSLDDMIWPFKIIYYITPCSYFSRSFTYSLFVDATWDSCTDRNTSVVCTPSTNGKDVLDAIGRIYPLFSSKNTVVKDIAAMIAMAIFWKFVHVMVFFTKARKIAHVSQTESK